MLCNVHQPLRYLAKSVHAVNGSSAPGVDPKSLKWGSAWHQRQEHLQSWQGSHSELQRSLGLQLTGHGGLAEPGSDQEKWHNHLLHLLWMWQWFPDVPSLEFPCQFRPSFVRHARSGLGGLGCLVHKKTTEMWLWCQKPQQCSLKWLFFNYEEPRRISVFSQEHPSSREHIVF